MKIGLIHFFKLKKKKEYKFFWFKCNAYGEECCQTALGAQKEVISHLFLHKPTVNISNSNCKLKNGYIYPSY